MRAVALALTLALLPAACGEDGGGTRRSAAYGPADAPATGCGPLAHPPEQSGGHLLAGATPPVPYSSTPPTSGWHASGFPERGLHGEDAPLSEPEQVTILELGGIVITWNGLDAAQRATLEQFVERNAKVVAATPYDKLPDGQVALAAWGAVRHCGSLDIEAIEAFVAEHAGGGPEH